MRVSTKIRLAPIEDLLKYFDEIYLEEVLPNQKHFFTFIEKYYKTLTNYNISLPNNLIFPTLCKGNYCLDPDTCPLQSGLLLYRNQNGREEFALTFRGPSTEYSQTKQRYDMWLWRTTRNGDLSREPFCVLDWDAWGYMSELFEYPNVKMNKEVPFGLETLELHDNGYSVLLLQMMLKKFDEETPISGYFCEKTEEIVKNMQSAFSISPTGKLEPEELIKVMQLIYGGK